MSQSEIFLALSPVVEAFKKMGINYYIGGSVASSAYGVARATLDVDIVADIKKEHVTELVQLLQKQYYIDGDMILGAIKNSSTCNFIHLATMIKIDVFIKKNDDYSEISANRVVKDSLPDDEGENDFNFVSPEDIILNKILWYKQGGCQSEKQWNDIIGVLKVQTVHLDHDYLKQWAHFLSISDLLTKVINDSQK